MGCLQDIYRTPLGLLTDLYQLTMAQGYWKLGRSEQEAAFHLFFRQAPFGGGYAVAAGLDRVVDHLRHFRLEATDLDYLAGLTGNDEGPLFDPDFLTALGRMPFQCDVDAVPEGTVVFAQEPLVRVTGPILQAQVLETALLNLVNFPTLVATKASRICAVAGDDPVLEFGLRRAQGIDGSLTASRAAYLGGCAATSNLLAGKLYDIPVRGTHAHSWVMAFDDEAEAFAGYARALPNNCVFLVDTYDTLEGVGRAIAVGQKLRRQGHKLVGIRLDSGDLAYLSMEARRRLDEAGFEGTAIVASNDLDEHLIQDLKAQGAPIAIWGVGTRLAVAHDQPALGGVYKLGAVRQPGGAWEPRIKLSEKATKTTIPGVLAVRRFELEGRPVADMIYDLAIGIGEDRTIIDPGDPTRHRRIEADATSRDLLVPVTREGEVVYPPPDLHASRDRARRELAQLHPGIRRFKNPHQYPVGLEAGLHSQRARMIAEARASTKETR